MSRLVLLLIVLVALVGGAYFLSTLPTKQPTKTVEIEVAQPGNGQ